MKTFIIAEAGVNHNGSEELAHRLVETAARCGADAVKFQTFSADRLVRRGARAADYQERETGSSDQHALLKSLELPIELHHSLIESCEKFGIEFMSTPFDEESADFLAELGMKRFKIPSGEITNEPFIAHIARHGLPIILSTGMADLAEIERAVQVIEAERGSLVDRDQLSDSLTILHCTSNYPAAYADVNLRAMDTIAQKTGLPVGYSDHTLGVAVSTAAVARGATVIEKHFTLDRALPGPDHSASLTVDELTAMIDQIRAVEQALGSSEKKPSASELPVRMLVRRSVTLVKALAAGDVVQLSHLALMRPGDGIRPAEMGKVVGKRVKSAMEVGSTLHWADLE